MNATRTKSTVPYTAFLQDTLGSSSSGCAQHALQPILQQQKQQPTIGKMTMKSRPTTTDTENPRKFSRTYKRGVDMFTERATQGVSTCITGRATKRVVNMFNWKDNTRGVDMFYWKGNRRGVDKFYWKGNIRVSTCFTRRTTEGCRHVLLEG